MIFRCPLIYESSGTKCPLHGLPWSYFSSTAHALFIGHDATINTGYTYKVISLDPERGLELRTSEFVANRSAIWAIILCLNGKVWYCCFVKVFKYFFRSYTYAKNNFWFIRANSYQLSFVNEFITCYLKLLLKLDASTFIYKYILARK